MEYNTYKAINAERSGRILTLTMNRPKHLNAIDEILHEELSRIFYDVAADNKTDVTEVITSMIGQAEHGFDSQCILVTKDLKLIKRVHKNISNHLMI